MCESAREQESNSRLVKTERFSSYNKLLRVVARVIAAVKMKSFKAAFCQPTPDGLKRSGKVPHPIRTRSFTTQLEARLSETGTYHEQ